MIPEGRPTMTVADIARAAGVPAWRWRRHSLPTMVESVPPLSGSLSPEIWDEAQVRAYLAGKPVPPLPEAPSPADLLSADEVGALVGLDASTVRAYQSSGQLPRGVLRHGVRWCTREAAEEAATGLRRGRGRAPGSKDRSPRRRTPAGEQAARRIQEVAALLAEAEAGHRPAPTVAQLAETYGVTPRTAGRWITTARQHLAETTTEAEGGALGR